MPTPPSRPCARPCDAPWRNAHGTTLVACDVDGSAHHVEDAIDASDERNALDRQTDRLQHHGKHDHARTRNASGADRGEHSGVAMVNCWLRVKSMPNTCAMKMEHSPCKSRCRPY